MRSLSGLLRSYSRAIQAQYACKQRMAVISAGFHYPQEWYTLRARRASLHTAAALIEAKLAHWTHGD